MPSLCAIPVFSACQPEDIKPYVFLNPFRAALQICSFPGWSLVVLYYGVGSICQVCNEIGDGNQTRFRESPSLIIIIFFFICLRVTFAFVYATFLRMRK